MAFLDVSSQWRTIGSSVMGIDYTAVEATFRMLGKAISPDQFRGLQIMEQSILKSLSKND